MLEVAIRKNFGKFKLDVSFTAPADAPLGLLGASGCGKSITLKCIAGIQRPDWGRIVLNGRTLFDSEAHIDLPPQKRRVGYLFQNYALFPHMTVAQNIAAGVWDRDKVRDTTAQLLESFFLEDLRDKYPRQLSGGQQQRTALARILASRPKALLLDEPFSALDDYLRWQVSLELMDRLEGFSGPVLLVTHDRNEVRKHCASVCVLDHGRSQAVQPVEELFSAPATLSAFLLSGGKNYSRLEREKAGVLRAVDWGISFPAPDDLPEGAAYVGIPCRDIPLLDEPGPVPCRVLRVTEDEGNTLLLLSTPGGDTGLSRLRLDVPRARLDQYPPGAVLYPDLRDVSPFFLTP